MSTLSWLTGGRTPLRFLTATVVLTVVLLLVLGAQVFRSYRINEKFEGRSVRLKELIGTIAHLDEVLTMSARMAVVTGNLEWRDRYNHFEPELTRAIEEIERFAPGIRTTGAVTQADEANRRLIEMERRALQLVAEENLAEAHALLFSQEYEAQKWIYSQGMDVFTAELRQQIEAAQGSRQRHLAFSLATIGALLLILVAAWVLALWVMRVWQDALLENNRRLELSTSQLQELNRTLDQKVAGRTAELQSRNEELAKQQRAMQDLLRELQEEQQKSEAHNQELSRREGVMQSLLEDLNAAKDRIEQQASVLQSANSKLKDLAVLKDEFVAKVSHELRTPLTSVKEGLSLLLDNALGAINADQRDFVQTMDGDIDRLTGLINNMLDISKIEAGRMRLTRGRVEMPQLIESLTRSYHAIMGHRVVHADIEGGLPPVFGDPNRLLQILTNLLSNAIKFTQDNGRITFRLASQNGMVAVTVQDDGTGVAAEDLPKLFQKFSQVGSAPLGMAAPRGTGLGLVVCKELAELHGGTIEVASKLGQGTTFTVRLPAYSERLVLAESFREQLEAASPSDGQMASLIAIQAAALADPRGSEADRRQWLEQLAQAVRQHLHRGDTVVTLEPSWIVVTAVTEASGLKAIVRRLREKMVEGPRLLFGAAVYPQDGAEAGQLFERAVSRVSEGAPELPVSSAPKPTTEPA